jgi:hypothetical protein
MSPGPLIADHFFLKDPVPQSAVSRSLGYLSPNAKVGEAETSPGNGLGQPPLLHLDSERIGDGRLNQRNFRFS